VTIRRVAGVIVLVALATATLAAGQVAFRSKVDGVQVDVAVIRGGQTVAGLTPANFVVTDNGVVQEVTSAFLSTEPLRLTLVLDLSQSVAGTRLTSLIKGSRAMVKALRPEDQA
jgi:hypothetical protein